MNDGARDVWYFYRDGQQSGALTFADLKEKADEGLLRPRHDLVWKAGMTDWRPIGEIEGIFPPPPAARESGPPVDSPPRPAGIATAVGDFEDETLSLIEDEDPPAAGEDSWPGIRRWGFFGAVIFFSTIAWLAPVLAAGITSLLPAVSLWSLVFGIRILVLPGIFFCIFQRFANLGMSYWWILSFLLPGLNCWTGYRLIVCPAGYAVHRKMDSTGVFLATVYWFAVGLAAIVMLVLTAVSHGTLGSRELIRQLQNLATFRK